MERQTEIDWTRASQLALLRDMRLETLRSADGTAVRPKVLLAVLRMIDEHGRGREAWVSYETLALKTGLGVRSVKRAVEVLGAASLLCVELRRSVHGVVCNHYRIVWSELALKCSPATVPERSERRPERADVEPERSAVATERSAVATERSAVATLAECRGGTQTALPPMKRIEPPPPTPSAAGGGWSDLIDEWRSRIGQIPELAHQAQADGEQLGDFRSRLEQAWATATSPANAGRFRKPAGAVVHFLRRGCWPVDRVVEFGDAPAEQAAIEEANAVDERRRRREFEEACLAAHQAVFIGRRQRATDDAISAALRQRFPPAVVEAIGWGGGVEVGGDQIGEAR